ncbi:hypothetical protein, partial [Rhodomicrobium vannielii]|uniref:hypothetical protein n=1 Tax=Rhodomicrobium vannielii TaxID=1069 RepID=UPI001FF06C20
MNPDDLRVGLWLRGAQDRPQGDPFGGDTDPENPVWDDSSKGALKRDKQAIHHRGGVLGLRPLPQLHARLPDLLD